jgi:methionine-rich copper-binding protein CopC
MRRSRLRVAALVAAGLLGLGAGPALAHGGLVDAEPGPGEPATVGLTEIRLQFDALAADEPVEVTVTDEAGTDAVTTVRTFGDGQVLVTVRALRPGVHLLDYVVTPADGHATKGGYYLEVVGAGERSTLAEQQGRTVAVALGVTAATLVAGLGIVALRRRVGAGPGAGTGAGAA